ncbi:malonate--CoA ligase ACSF3, mitochondrial [Rhipicephalus microplus]|uniref:malonate--CoA ligase ACSF3, mitochondrial n=1 Tax=Rhipicephalus microplus TaxID=6941 RepID=UPI00188937A2|nr:malonate--CoA ligase ACSF3, mitochondrial-like isoform X1 [Rhipicephalus microplus]
MYVPTMTLALGKVRAALLHRVRLPRRSLHSFPPPFESIFNRAASYQDRLALVDVEGTYTYSNLLASSTTLQAHIDDVLKGSTKERISFLCPNAASYVIAQWACWLGGNVAVPLYWNLPRSVLEYYIRDSQSSLLVSTKTYADHLQPIARELDLPLVVLGEEVKKETYTASKQKMEEWKRLKHKDAQILYTSGTTGPPKGVVTTHNNLFVQALAIISAWEFSSSDAVLHTLPLHHTHGIVNALVAPMYAGSTCVMLPKFEAADVWNYLIESPTRGPRINVYMAVPTIYAKLIQHYDKMFSSSTPFSRSKEFIRAACTQKIRLMVSGSASLPLPVLERWKEITGHTLLERYGMTEIGMALTNPLHGTRKPGFVGKPFPGVKVCLAKPNAYAATGYDVILTGDEYGTKVVKGSENESGDLLVKGPNVFKEYWNKPKATKEAFTSDGWFKTGDTAEYIDGAYKILGRTSSDIIKSGGYKISALDVERHLLAHPDIQDCVVVGLPDITWGEKVACAVTLRDPTAELTLLELREWSKARMEAAMIPVLLQVVQEIPRNAMGKVNKKDIASQLFSSS